jgi:hypothetical protein
MTRYSLTINQSYLVTLDGEPDESRVQEIARKVIARYSNMGGVIDGGRRWHAITHDPKIGIEIMEKIDANILDEVEAVPIVEDKKPPRVDEELDIF